MKNFCFKEFFFKFTVMELSFTIRLICMFCKGKGLLQVFPHSQITSSTSMAIPYVQQRGGDRSHDTWTFLVQILRSSVLQPVHFAVHGGECYSPPFAVGRTTVGAFCSTRGRTRENYSRCLSQYTRENTPARGPFGANSTIRGATFGGFKFVGLHEMILLIVILP